MACLQIGYISHAPEAVDSYRHPLGDAKEPPLSWTLAGDPSVIFPWSAHVCPFPFECMACQAMCECMPSAGRNALFLLM